MKFGFNASIIFLFQARINNKLVVTAIASRIASKHKLNAARQAEALRTIERNAKLQSQLIEDLLDISRIMQGKWFFIRPFLVA